MTITTLTLSHKITKPFVDGLDAPSIGQSFVRGIELKEFVVRITVFGAKSFFLEKIIDGKVNRLTPSRYLELTVEQAGKEAHKLRDHIVAGRNPSVEKKQEALKSAALKQALMISSRSERISELDLYLVISI